MTTCKSPPLTNGPIATSAAIPLLWARERIAMLSDYAAISSQSSRTGPSAEFEEIRAIGLEFGLMTELTSFVAVDSADNATGNTCPRTHAVDNSVLPSLEAAEDFASSRGGRGGYVGTGFAGAMFTSAHSAALRAGGGTAATTWLWLAVHQVLAMLVLRV